MTYTILAGDVNWVHALGKILLSVKPGDIIEVDSEYKVGFIHRAMKKMEVFDVAILLKGRKR